MTSRMCRKSLLILLPFIIFGGCHDQNDEPLLQGTIAGNRITSIYIDEDGIKWFGTENGLSAYDGITFRNYNAEDGLPENQINDICARAGETGSQLLVATGKGVGMLDRIGNLIQTISILLSSNSGLAGDRIYSLTHDHVDVTWFGTEGGISVQYEGHWMDSDENDLNREYKITDIAPGPDSISFVCLSGRGVALMDPGVDAVTTVTYYEWPFSPLPSDNVQAIYIEHYHHQWIGTDQGLAFHGNFDPKQQWELYHEEDGLINNNVLSVRGDGKGVTWIGTAAGVSRYDGAGWTSYAVRDGLAGDSVYCIAMDLDGSVWFGTNHGASHFNGITWTNFRAK
jgi:ligand-binding sensor domain-containing protein